MHVCLAYGTINKYIDDAKDAEDVHSLLDHKIINGLSAIQLAMTLVIKHFQCYML